MRRISFHNEGEEHNFWQNYTDIMSGLLIVFIITSLFAYNKYKKHEELYNKHGITEANINDYVVNHELYEKFKEIQEAQKSLDSTYFKYNENYERLECAIDVQFKSNDSEIPDQKKDSLISAGKKLEEVVERFKSSRNVSFRISIEGRAAKYINDPLRNNNEKEYAAELSYKRARSLYLLWQKNNILKDTGNGEVLISGSGFEGKGRHPNIQGEEEKNKTFIIQIIPYATFTHHNDNTQH